MIEHENEALHLAALSDDTGLVQRRVFKSCQILGPAILAIGPGAEYHNCTFALNLEDIDRVFWTIPEGREWVLGVVGFQEVRFEGCIFGRSIGWAGHADTIVNMKNQWFPPNPDA